MPPKKGASKATAPSTITTNRGKEIEATAAADRPRRAAAAVATTPATKKKTATPAKAKSATQTQTSSGKKRGRPAKAVDVADEPPKKRGRKAASKEDEEVVEAAVTEPPKKGGRPSEVDASAEVAEEAAAPPKKRGRRPAKQDAPAVPDKAAPKKRGRPPYGGETTKIAADGDAVEQQLDGELKDAAEEPMDEPAKSKREVPVSKKGAKGKKAAVQQDDEEVAEQDDNVDAVDDAEAPAKQYWLMKAEQEDRLEETADHSTFNTKFTIDDLRAKNGPELWDGVRNLVAAKNMKTMRKGDLAFFYASGGKQGRKPGIVGIMEVVSEAEPDITAADKGHYAYIEKESDRAKWVVVGVEFRKKLSAPVTLKELQKYGKDKGVLKGMQVLTQARLSVSKVTEKQWEFITEELIEGYEAEDEQHTLAGKHTDAITTGEAVDRETEATAAPNGFAATAEMAEADYAADLPDGMADNDTSGPHAALPTIESDLLTTDTMLPAETVPTSKPASRAASRQASRAPSVAPVATSIFGDKVRASSLRPGSRGRSRTPKPRAASAQPAALGEGMEAIQE